MAGLKIITLVFLLFSGASLSQTDVDDSDEAETLVKQINIGFFLGKYDELTELAIRSSINIVNSYLAVNQYFLNPLIHRIKENEISNLANIMCDFVELGVAAIFGPGNPETNEIIQSMSASLEIPQFQTFWNPNFEAYSEKVIKELPFNLNVYPHPKALSKAFATLVRENDWKSYTVIYEDDDGLVKLQEVLKAQNPNDPPVTYRKLGSGMDHRTLLKEVGFSGAIHIILDCETDHIIPILLQAQEIKLLAEYHSYILTSLDVHTLDFTPLGEIKANVSCLNLLDQNLVNEVLNNWELVDLQRRIKIPNKSLKVKTSLLYDALNLFITSFSQLESSEELIIKPLSCGNEETSLHGYRLAASVALRNMSKGLLPGPISGPIGFNALGQRSLFRLEIIELTNQQFRVTGIWDSNHPNQINSTVTLEDREKERFQQLKGKKFRVASRIYKPYIARKVPTDGRPLLGNDAFEGYAMDLIDMICKILNCTYEFQLVPDNNYGRYNPETKEWNGLIRHLLDRKADLAVCDLSTTYERRKAVDFTNPFMTLGISILYAKVSKEPPELLAFTNPLSLDIWLYMGTAYVVMSVIIFLVARLNPHEWENPHPCNENPEELENIWNLKNCFWLTMGSIMTQGCDILPKGISTRMVAGMWWFFSLIITSCYTANLAAFLTQDRMGPTIKSAEDLASQSKIKYGCLEDGATASFFKDTNVTTYHKMWVQMMSADPSVFEKSNDDGVKRVINSKGKYAFLMESSSIEYEVEKHCELVQVGSRLDTKGYGIAMPTNAPYRTAINQAILRMQETGQLQQLKQKWWKDKNKGTPCKKDEDGSTAAAAELGLPHVGGVFVVLAGGMSIAFIMAMVEFLWNVKKIAVRHHITLKEALDRELKFAMNVGIRRKVVRRVPNGDLNLTNKDDVKINNR